MDEPLHACVRSEEIEVRFVIKLMLIVRTVQKQG